MNSAYLEDASGYQGHADRLFLPANEVELQDILREASQANTAVTIAGAGTGVAGGRVPKGGWIVSLEKFRTLQIDSEKREVQAGAGILLNELQAAVAKKGFFYAPDPTEQGASVGGTVATNASGSRGFRCGDTRRHVNALRVVFADGTARTFRRGDKIDFPVDPIRRPRTTKNSCGFPLEPGMDWVDLFIGSEGTLAAVTEATLHLVKTPKEVMGGVCFFSSEDAALAAVDAWRAVPRLRMLEYFDHGSLLLLREKYDDIPPEAQAALLIEQELLDDAELDAWIDRLEEAGAMTEQSWFAASDTDRDRFRRFRHALPEAVNTTVRQRGLMKMGTDFAVPLDRNQEMMAYYRRTLDPVFPGQYVIFGHVGDAHVHVNILPKDEQEAELAKALITGMARQAVAFGGTVAAEHGLGKRKSHLLEIQYCREEIEAMLRVKQRLDPQCILGQGNLFGAIRFSSGIV